jgi:hypothetical protein
MTLLSVFLGSMAGTEVFIILFACLIPLAILVLPLMALIDILKNNFKGNDKIVWVLVVILLPIVGSILYFAIGSGEKLKEV